jgi:outer membrane protein W
MKSNRSLLVLLAFLVSAPLAAQGNVGVDLGVWASWTRMAGPTEFELEQAELTFDDANGFGISANFFWGRRISTELAVYSLRSDAVLTGSGNLPYALDLGSMNLTPITGTLQFHFAREAFLSPYVGVGVAHVIVGNLESDDLNLVGIGPIDVDDEFSYVANAGLSLRLTPNFSLGLDAKYIPLRPGSRALGDVQDVELRIDPLIVSVGARFRF